MNDDSRTSEEIFGDTDKIVDYEFHHSDTTKSQFNLFDQLVRNNSNETKLDNFITKNPEILTTVLNHFGTGNHKGWVFPKLTLTPKIEHMYQKGMIPDFILGGQSSDGQEWWIIELKGANEQIFKISTNNRIRFSDTVNKGICQLLEYVDYSSEKQSYLRENFGLTNFREPNGLLIVGREDEVNGNYRKKKLKSSWNRLNKGKLEIRTFDWLLREFRRAIKKNENWKVRKAIPLDEYISNSIGDQEE